MKNKLIQIMASSSWHSPFDEPFQRDMVRLERRWEGQTFIQILPASRKAEGAIDPAFCLVTGETSNFITIYNVHKGGIWPTPNWLQQSDLKDGGIYRLYERWLNSKISAATSAFDPGLQKWLDTTMSLDFGMQRRDGHHETLVSPETYAETLRTNLPGYLLQAELGAPFDDIFKSAGVDLLYHRYLMAKARFDCRATDRSAGLKEATIWKNRLSVPARASLEKAWLKPRLGENQIDVLEDLESNFGIEANKIPDLYTGLDALIKLYLTEVDVIRCTGWLGFFWLCLHNELSSKARDTNLRCVQCGKRLVNPRPNQQMCRKLENPKCRRQYNRLKKQQSRI
jgi:hypothetical protein